MNGEYMSLETAKRVRKYNILLKRIRLLKQENKRQKEVINGMIENEEKYLLEINKLKSIIKEVREYITSYESIETIQQCEHSENNKGLDEKTMIEMDRRYLIVHDKILQILDKEN